MTDGAPPRALDDTIITPPTAQFAGLGRGRDLVTEELRDFCIGSTGTIMDYSHAYSRLYLDEAMTRDQIKSTFSTSGSASALWGIVDAEASFKRTTEENDYSLVVVYGVDYTIGGKTLDPNTRRLLVDPAVTPNWFTRCGDHFLMQTDLGGQLFVLARIEFNSQTTKTEFKTALGGSFGWGKVKATLENNRERFKSRAVIHVEAFQKGGNVAALGAVIGGAGAVDCGMSSPTELSKCNDVISKVLAYAGSSELITGMKETPADLRYYWVSWRTVLANPPPAREVPAELVPPRQLVKDEFAKQIALERRLAIVAAGVSSGQLWATNRFKADLSALGAALAHNREVLTVAARRCFDDLDDPADAAARAACLAEASADSLRAKGYDSSITLARLEPSKGPQLWLSSSTRSRFNAPVGDLLPAQARGPGVRVHDFNGDGLSDLLFSYADASGWHNAVAQANGPSFLWTDDWLPGKGVGATYVLGTFNGDRRCDLLLAWWDASTGVWRNTMFVNTLYGFREEAGWLPDGVGIGATYYPGDYNGDGLTDVLLGWWDASNRLWHNTVYLSTGAALRYAGDWTPGNVGLGAKYQLGDYNGDGATDVLFAWEDTAAGVLRNSMYLSTRSGLVHAGTWLPANTGAGASWYPGDFSGDGKTDILFAWDDLGVWRNTVYTSTGNGFTGGNTWLSGAGVGMDYLIGSFDASAGQDVAFITWY